MFIQMIYFVKFRIFTLDDGRARLGRRGDICRQSPSRQMSDNRNVDERDLFTRRRIYFRYKLFNFFRATCHSSDNS